MAVTEKKSRVWKIALVSQSGLVILRRTWGGGGGGDGDGDGDGDIET